MSIRSPSTKNFSSLPGRKFLRSQYLHDEQAVQQRIAKQVLKLDQLSQKFGVPPKCNLLSNEHLQIVQQALHGHLEILPTDVLQRMIECEGSVNSIIEKEWVPREKTRQQALEVLKVQTQTKSQLNQELVRQAMTAFSSVSDADTGEKNESDRTISRREVTQAMPQVNVQEYHEESRDLGQEEKMAPEYVDPMQEEVGRPSIMHHHLPVIAEERPLVVGLCADTLNIQPSEDSKDGGVGGPTEIDQPSDGRTQKDTESEPLIDNANAEEETFAVMKAVTVSPKSSPVKTEPVRTTHEQDLVPENSVVEETDAKTHGLSSLQATESVGESTASHATETGIKEDDDYVRVDLQALEINGSMHPAGDYEDEEVKSERGNEEQLPLGAVSSASALSNDELENLEVVDIQSTSDAARLPDNSEGVMRGENGVIDSTESVRADQHDRASASYDRDDIKEMSNRSQLRSFRSSEFSASMVTSSELSFQASIPSLEESDSNISDLGASRTDEKVRIDYVEESFCMFFEISARFVSVEHRSHKSKTPKMVYNPEILSRA